MRARINRQDSRRKINNLIRKRIQTIAQENGLSEQVQSVFVNLFDYMMKKKLCGCCHAFSSALYVALCELGESPQLCIGECYNPKEKFFDHSWILLNGKIIDIAIYMPLSQRRNSITGVVIMDIDTVTQEKSDTEYGCKKEFGLNDETKKVKHISFIEYMNIWPFESNGLWSVVKSILSDTMEFDIDSSKAKYADTKRIFCVKEGENDVSD